MPECSTAIFRASGGDELNHLLETLASGRLRSVKSSPAASRFVCRTIPSRTLEMFAIRSTFSATFAFDPAECVRMVLLKNCDSRIAFGPDESGFQPQGGGFFLPSGMPVVEHHPSGYAALAVRFDQSDLKKKAAALCGTEVCDDITFSQPQAGNDSFQQFIRRPLIAAMRELESMHPCYREIMLADVKALALTRLLLYQPHNYSDRIAAASKAPSTAQLKIAEAYLASHLAEPLDLERLSLVVGVSARTILRHFRKRYGETPREFLQKRRLERAYDQLSSNQDEVNVGEVALLCGYANQGRFAALYRQQFRELPSETLRRRRHASHDVA